MSQIEKAPIPDKQELLPKNMPTHIQNVAYANRLDQRDADDKYYREAYNKKLDESREKIAKFECNKCDAHMLSKEACFFGNDLYKCEGCLGDADQIIALLKEVEK